MKTYKLKTYSGTYEIELEKTEYTNGRLAIIMNMVENGKVVDEWGVLTVNLPSEPMFEGNCAYIDTNNNGNEIIEWLRKNGIAKANGFYGFSGFCAYPMVEFDMNKF